MAALQDDLAEAKSKTDHISRQRKNATAVKELQSLGDKLSRWDRTRRRLCEDLRVQEAKAKYVRWGGRPLGRFDPFDEIQKAILDFQATEDDTAVSED